ncbi:peptidoglycan-binding protein [Streptomyces sp. NPDC058157]|uniref:peptidoglycan-binding protein n=1 Tax=Streptomyces sp. NPDC058157 TaxID=3346360 RepID=UPI0036E57811
MRPGRREAAPYAAPAFEDIPAPADCGCAGCTTAARPTRHPDAQGRKAVRAALVTAVAGCTLASGAGGAFAADSTHPAPPPPTPPVTAPPSDDPTTHPDAGNEQGAPGPLFGAQTLHAAQDMRLSREQIIARAKTWVDAQVPYDMNRYWSDGYRQDCSGLVSMAWGLKDNQWTGSLAAHGTRIGKSELQPGDILLFHNAANPVAGSHVVIFGGWANGERTRYVAYEQTRPHAITRTTPYAYWRNSSGYVAYRYKNLTSQPAPPGQDTEAFPGADKFGPGADNRHVTELGRMLAKRGAGAYYTSGPGPRWSEADRKATQAFQRAQGWTGADADGIPGRTTWDYLVHGKGKDIPPPPDDSRPGQDDEGRPAFPGAGHFRPGQVNEHVLTLGRQLVRKGFGRHYAIGPSTSWGEADRRNVAEFQRAQGWTGTDADGYPGEHTWRRLFG